jgi:tRNA nucleotidyltransferase (CCA-adding enzyme)
MLVLQMAARLQAPLPVRWACLMHDLGKGTTPAELLPRHLGHEQRSSQLLKAVGQRLRVPGECTELADVVAREHGNIHRSAGLNAAALLRLLERCDALRKPERFADVLLACECDARGRLGFEEAAYPSARACCGRWTPLAVATEPVARAAQARGARGPQIGAAVQQARAEAVARALDEAPGAAASA